jgi:hypothetical protein
MLAVPLSFDPSPWDEDAKYLSSATSNGKTFVTWRDLGLSVAHVAEDWPTLLDLAENTLGLYFHGQFGFSLERYSEFFVEELPNAAAFRFGNTEITFGQPSPLICYMFERNRDEHYHGGWDNLTTIRILGCEHIFAELVLLNAFNHYEDRYGSLPRVNEISEIEWDVGFAIDEQDLSDNPIVCSPSLPADVEPLRCMYYARSSTDPASACIQFYRVLEYYAFFAQSQRIGSLRRDSSVSDRDFLVSAAQLLTKDEKTPIVKLISELVKRETLELAAKNDLIKAPESNLIGVAAYEFRNAVVHAKYDQRTNLIVDPVISAPTSTNVWRRVLHQLAKDAIARYATRKFISDV